ncbi:hypothetical protein [Falsibacillus albus]|uniref:Uncharacterized protein n=1 Tax=Falsibacillus albus TaxID=2478915 RepID=A0A3L7JNQ7_9BACI|nr:hypothetical protein [Falsibacillus albus]RLQ92413.1 hypothetical protein D9X91_19395 [Falsibacillus albus]
MNKKSFWIPFSTAIGTIILLYGIGSLFHIPSLMWTFYKANPSEDVKFEAGGSLNPIFIGFIAGFVADGIYRFKQKHRSSIE